jgi:hypothetical protein
LSTEKEIAKLLIELEEATDYGELVITQKMIDVGVEVYNNPKQYESYESTVIEIFCAMLSASDWNVRYRKTLGG